MYNSGKKNNRYGAFTLVELIVVIIILAILASIAFISFNSYNSSARDSVRVSDISQIYKGLAQQQVFSGKFPKPENSIFLFSGTSLIGYQGNMGENILKMINLSSGGGIDPTYNTYYSYNTNSTQTKAQLVGFLENPQSLAFPDIPYPQAAAAYQNNFTFSKGDPLCFILYETSSGTYIPAHEFYGVGASLYTDSGSFSSGANCVLDNSHINPKLSDTVLLGYTGTGASYIRNTSSSLTPPVALAATNIGLSSITWNWGTSSGAARYEFSIDNTNWTSLGNIMTYNETGLSPSMNVTRYVRACDSGGCSNPTGLMSATSLANVFVAKNGTGSASCGAISLPCNTINLGISKASSGQIVYVSSGTYNENVNITNKTIKLYGESKINTKIKIYAVLSDGADHKAITISNSPNTQVQGFTLDLTTAVGSFYQLHGIHATASAYMTLKDLIIYSSTSQYIQGGITLMNSSYTSVLNSKITTAYNAGIGIIAQTNTYGMTVRNSEIAGPWFNGIITESSGGSDGANIVNNHIKGTDSAIQLRWNSNVINNTIVGNKYGVTYNYGTGEFKNNIIAYNMTRGLQVGDSSYKITGYNNTFFSNGTTYNSNYISTADDMTGRDPKFTDNTYMFLSAISSGQGSDSPELDSGIGTLAGFGITNNSTSTNGQDDTGVIDRGYHWKQ